MKSGTSSFCFCTMKSIGMFVLMVVALPASKSAPVPVEMVDMSYVIDQTTLYWPNTTPFNMTVLFNGTIAEGIWFQTENYTSSTHAGTHMDAPRHFSERGWSVDQIPLTHLVAEAAVIDITQRAEKDRDALLLIEDLENWESQTGQNLNGTIVMVRSGWGSRWPDREAFTGTADLDVTHLHFPAVSAEAAQWLVDNRSIYGLGTETLSIDNNMTINFMSHRIILGSNIYVMENVANMDKLPIYGATLYVLPMKIGNSSGAPTRIIATYSKKLLGGYCAS